MMSTIAGPGFLGKSCYGINLHANIQRRSASWTIAYVSLKLQDIKFQFFSHKEEKRILRELQKVTITQHEVVTQSNLQFDRSQPTEEDLIQENRVEFGQFVAREALLGEEYWTAAWLRADCQWEDKHDRYADNYKRKYAEQEFNLLKRRCRAVWGQKCTCIVVVKKEEKNVNCTLLKSVVGTLDLSIGLLSHGQTFPGEHVKLPLVCNIDRKAFNQFGYIANVCVAKSVRRQGVASNMLEFSIRSAKANGAEHVFVHVHRNNNPAQKLYQKMGFELVEKASFQLSDEQSYLLRLKA